MQAPDAITIDADFIETNDKFYQQARRKILDREEVVVGDRYSSM